MFERHDNVFIGCESEFEQSKIVLFGAPFDGTTSYRPGARFASSAIRTESYGIETYSPYLDKDLTDISVYDAGDIELPFGNTQRALDMIENFAEKIISANKMPLMLGGEHLVTLSVIRALIKKHPDMHIIHFDAHADLRDDYLGEKLSHACVMRRCWEILGDSKIHQFGIRSGDKDEFYWAENHVNMCKFNFDTIDDTIKQIADKPVYLSIDLDVLDPSEFPATGTPEAGGVSFNSLIDALKRISSLNIISADMVELSPPYDISGTSTALACKLLRELLLNIYK